MNHALSCLVRGVIGLTTALVLSVQAQAATITVVSSESAFLSLIGGPPAGSEDFSGFVGTTITAGADFGPFSVDGGGVSVIDGVTTGFSPIVDINGAYLLTGSAPGFPLSFEFDAPIIGFAALFSNIDSAPILTIDGVGSTTLPTASGIQFIGIVSDMAFTTFSLESAIGDGFGIDDILFATSAAPVPAQGAGLLLGVALLGLSLRRRSA